MHSAENMMSRVIKHYEIPLLQHINKVRWKTKQKVCMIILSNTPLGEKAAQLGAAVSKELKACRLSQIRTE